MPTRARKTRKMRGSGGCGYGCKKKHRGGGSRGGRGRAGLMKHKKSLMVTKHPDHFGRYGFKVPVKVKSSINAISLRSVDILARKLGINDINLLKHGYNKVLSNGKLTQALTIRADAFTEKAKQKIIDAGGTPVEPEKAK